MNNHTKTIKVFSELSSSFEDTEIITEQTESGKKEYFLAGICMQCDTINRNRRKYPKRIIERELERLQPHVEEKRVFGELGHPTPSVPIINYERVSHIFTSLVMEGKNVIAKAKIIDTDKGKLAKTLISEGSKLGLSLRGAAGKIIEESDGIKVFTEEFHLVTPGDIVHDPSFSEAFVEAVYESDQKFFDCVPSVNPELMGDYKKMLLDARKDEINKLRLKIFKDFLGRL